MGKLNKLTLGLLLLGSLLIIYGYVAILSSLNFFWESKSIGWVVLFLGIFGLLIHLKKSRKSQNKKSVLHIIGMVLIGFILIIKTILWTVIPNSDAYEAVKQFALSENTISDSVGEIQSISYIPAGGMSVTTTNGVTEGNATIRIIAKGTKAYQVYEFYLFIGNDKRWEVYEYQ